MDLFYGEWTIRQKAWVDVFTIFSVIFFLGVMLYGAWDSTAYSLKYGERSPTAWRPYMWPIKITMVIGFFLMLLQAISELIKDIAIIKGWELAPNTATLKGEV
jgi:TRAP-type mannitol/chloroaromatic compound transport system permease small subunit